MWSFPEVPAEYLLLNPLMFSCHWRDLQGNSLLEQELGFFLPSPLGPSCQGLVGDTCEVPCPRSSSVPGHTQPKCGIWSIPGSQGTLQPKGWNDFGGKLGRNRRCTESWCLSVHIQLFCEICLAAALGTLQQSSVLPQLCPSAQLAVTC